MNDHRLDELSTRLAAAGTRRQMIKVLGGIVVGAMAGVLGRQHAEAQQGGCRGFGQSCRPQGAGNQCCSGLVCTGDPGTCVECRTVADCPTIQLGPCEARTCSSGRCGVGPAPAGTVCRAAAGPCDVAEVCTGASTTCPTDAFRPAGTVCRPAAGPCDVAEVCTGASAACPRYAVRRAGTVCRVASAPCEGTGQYTGASAAGPDVQCLP